MVAAVATALRRLRRTGTIALAACVLAGGATAQTLPPSPLTPTPRSEAAEIATLLRQGHADAALQRAEHALVDQPRNAQVRFLRAVALGELGRQDEARLAFEAMTQDYPELPEPYNNLAVLAAARGQLEQAERLLRQALEAEPRYATAEQNLGELYVAMSRAAFERALRLEPGNATVQSRLALVRELGSRLRQAP